MLFTTRKRERERETRATADTLLLALEKANSHTLPVEEAMGAESSRLPTASRKMGPHSYNCREVDSANQSDELGRGP